MTLPPFKLGFLPHLLNQLPPGRIETARTIGAERAQQLPTAECSAAQPSRILESGRDRLSHRLAP